MPSTVLMWMAAVGSLLSLVALVVLLLRTKAGLANALGSAIREEFRSSRAEAAQAARDLREEVSGHLKSTADTLVKAVGALGGAQNERLEGVEKTIKALMDSNERRMDTVRTTLDERIKSLQENNESKLDQMRQTVDEKLQTTLEKRLTESFKVVSESLDAVQRGLGEMQSLAAGVGDLKRVLTNVKTRGTWGEVQLGALLEDILTPDQYAANVQLRDGAQEAVDYAVRLPGRDDDPASVVWLPIDAKFPQEDYARLVEASVSGDHEGVKTAAAALIRAVEKSAKDIHDKYLNPPTTTDFAVLFLPTEGLYAEVLRLPGEVEKWQRLYRIVVAGPTTLAALLTSLRMGFRTLAIEKRSSEVWKVLAAVKTEFGKFGEVLSKVKRQLDTASTTIEETGVRTRAMARRLRSVEELPSAEASAVLGVAESEALEDPEAAETQS